VTEIDLKDIVGNTDNSRESAPRLQGLGYGIVEPGDGKPSLFALALGSELDKADYCKLVERHDERLIDLAQSIDRQGQLLNCRVRVARKGKYHLTFGCRRALAVLYLHAKSGGKTPAKVLATVGKGDGKAALFESAAENAHRLPPSLIDQGRLFERMGDAGMSVKEMAKVYPMGKATEQTVRHRIRLLELPADQQLEVHEGKMSQDAALKFLGEGKVGGRNSSAANAKHEPKGGESVAPGIGATPPPFATKEGADLRSLLQDFVNGMQALDTDGLRSSDPFTLAKLAKEAQRALAAVLERLSAVNRASA